jgi:hypothetical protein
MGMTDHTYARVQLRSTDLRVPAADLEELVRRLRAEPGGNAAAEELSTKRRFADDGQKQLALSTIETWFGEVDAQNLSRGIRAMRYELMRDLRLPPFEAWRGLPD